MKKLAVAAMIILFFLLLLGLLLFRLLGSSSHSSQPATQTSFPVATQSVGADSNNPEQFVSSFYEWYLLNFSRDPLFPHSENRKEILSPWFTNSFIEQWDEAQFQVDGNPVFLTGEDPTSWGTTVSARTLSQSIRTRVIHVVIGDGSKAHSYDVTLESQQGGGWKISTIASSS